MNYAEALLRARAVDVPESNSIHWKDMSELQKLACKLRKRKVLTVSFSRKGKLETEHCICIEEAQEFEHKLRVSSVEVVNWRVEVLVPQQVIRLNLGSHSVTKLISLLTGTSLFSDRFLVRTNDTGNPTGIIHDRYLNIAFRCEPDEISYLECHGKKNCAA